MQIQIMPKISRNEAAKLLGVSSDTLRRWKEEGKIEPERTQGGHRRYDVATLLKQSERSGKTICYARVSTRPQKADLERQATVLSAYCEQREWDYEVIRDRVGPQLQQKGFAQTPYPDCFWRSP